MELESESEDSKISPGEAVDAMNDGSDSKESWSPEASRRREQASNSNIKMTESAAKLAPRARSARKAYEKAK